MTKIQPVKKRKRFKKYNCSGKLRVDILVDDGEISEVIILPEGGGCEHNLELIGRLIGGMLDCNIDLGYVLGLLEKTTPCTAPVMRMKREGLAQDEVGVGGCPKIIKRALEEKMGELDGKVK